MDSEEVDTTHRDEMEDWLRDLEDRYDLGAVDDQLPPTMGLGAGDTRLAEVRRYRRTKNGFEDNAPAPDDGEHTGEMATLGVDAQPWHLPPPPPPERRHISRWAIAAVVLVVVGVGGLALALTNHGSKRGGGPNLAIDTPTTPPTALVGPPGVAVTQPPTSDTAATTPTAIPEPGPPPSAAPAVLTPSGTVAPSRTTPATTRTSTPRTSPPTVPHTTTPPVTTAPPVSVTTPPTTPAPKPPPDTTVPPATTTPTTSPNTVPFP